MAEAFAGTTGWNWLYWNKLMEVIKQHKIQSDSVTTARHFYFQFNIILKDILIWALGPPGKTKDWFYIVQYQQWSSHHIQRLIWLENEPLFGADKVIVAYIDGVITCTKLESNTNLLNIVNRQTHQHFHTWRKKFKNIFRFNYPQPPMKCSQIHYPLDNQTWAAVAKSSKELWKIIKERLKDFKEDKNIHLTNCCNELRTSVYPGRTVIFQLSNYLFKRKTKWIKWIKN